MRACPAVTAPPTGDESALYIADGDVFLPTILAQGPWDPAAQHGGPPAALLTRAVETVPSLVPMRIARLTIDLHRAVPLRRLRAVTSIRREGKRVQLVEAVLLDDDLEVARCSALRIRIGDTSSPAVVDHPRRPDASPPMRPGAGRPLHPSAAESPIGFIRAIEAERVVGDVGLGAPAVMWVRLRVPVVAGEIASPLSRLALTADFTSALASYLDASRYSYINPDFNVHVFRAPSSEWIAVDATTWVGSDGIGLGRAALFDFEGLVAAGTASQLVEEWSRPDWPRHRASGVE